MDKLNSFYEKLDLVLDREVRALRLTRATVTAVVSGQARILRDDAAVADVELYPVLGDETLIVGDEVAVVPFGSKTALVGPLRRAARTHVPVGLPQRFIGPAPSATAAAAAGDDPILTRNGNDMRGRVNLTRGSAPSAGSLWTLTFAAPKASTNYEVQLTARSSKAEESGFRVSSLGPTGFTVSTLSSGAAGDVFNLSYAVDEWAVT